MTNDFIINTDIFKATPEGLRLRKLLDAAIQQCSSKHHVLGAKHKRIKDEKINKLVWTCIDCEAQLVFDFKAGKVKGNALKEVCGGRDWDDTPEEPKKKKTLLDKIFPYMPGPR